MLGLVSHNFPTVKATVAALTEMEKPQLPSRPLNPPDNLMEDNMGLQEHWFLEHFRRTAFTVDGRPLPEMKGSPHHLHLHPDAQPQAVYSPASFPHHFCDNIHKQPHEDIRQGITKPVPIGELTDWCLHMVVVPKVMDGHAGRWTFSSSTR